MVLFPTTGLEILMGSDDEMRGSAASFRGIFLMFSRISGFRTQAKRLKVVLEDKNNGNQISSELDDFLKLLVTLPF